MGWKIIEDPSFNPDNTFGDTSRVGKQSEYQGGTMKIKVGDDDGNHYYTALCDNDESMETFFNWAVYDSGCTWSEYWDEERQEWRGFIS